MAIEDRFAQRVAKTENTSFFVVPSYRVRDFDSNQLTHIFAIVD